jgi:ATP/maltotriose-dependent transcriptional regulator MalT
MSTVLNAERRGRQAHFEGPDFERVSVLQGRLRALDRAAEDADTVVAACLVWVADALLDEASAALAAVPPADPGRPDLATPAGLLTEREHAVLVRLQEDAPLRQIGAELFVSHNTVKSHVRAVYRKLRVSSRTDAVARARQLGLL